nr:EOG090X09EK [Polyphemus pediculus]
MTRRALHFVLKVGDRNKTIQFYRDVLGMKVLRHEEFEAGCKATCNGPYDGKWSKTMIGYGPEDNHFVVELTYNYGVSTYKLGNDFLGLTIKSDQIIENAKKIDWQIATNQSTGTQSLEAPGGYRFNVIERNEPESEDPVQSVTLVSSNLTKSLAFWNDILGLKLNEPESEDPVQSVTLVSSNLTKSLAFWNDILGLKLLQQTDSSAILSYGENQAKLELKDIGCPIDHAKAFGRIAFSCPSSELPAIESKVKDANGTILTPLVSLDTPGKATVQVVIIADPDGHEICFVGDEAFRELSAFDPEADRLLNEALNLKLKTPMGQF